MGGNIAVIIIPVVLVAVIVAIVKKKGHIVLIVFGTILAVAGAGFYMASSSSLNNSDKMWTASTGKITDLRNTLAGSKVMAVAGIILLAIGVIILISRRRSSGASAQRAARHNAERTGAGFCPQCGNPAPPRTAFCARCGGSLSGPPEMAQAVPPAEKPPLDTEAKTREDDA